MPFGPIFNREFVLMPRRPRFYVLRAAYCLGLVILIATAWLILTGTQVVDTVGALARFGASMFHILAPLQLVIAVFFSALAAASSVAQEKDRQTLDLLLMTRLSNAELVLGKLFSSQIMVVVIVLSGLPIFALLTLFGGVSFGQIVRTTAVTLASMLVAASIGSTVAFWREKTFQALAGTVLALVVWVGLGEAVAAGLLGREIFGLPAGQVGALISPWKAVVAASYPGFGPGELEPQSGWATGTWVGFLAVSFVLVAFLNGVAIANVRRWAKANEPRPVIPEQERPSRLTQSAVHEAPSVGGQKALAGDGTRPASFVALGEGAQGSVSTLISLADATPASSGLEQAPGMAEGPSAPNEILTGCLVTPPQKSQQTAWRYRRALLEEAASATGAESVPPTTSDYRPWWLDLVFAPRKHTVRQVWSNPILWREMCTRAYGRRMIVLRLGYVLIFAAIALLVHAMLRAGVLAAEGLGGLALAALFLLSLVLVNAQAVSSLISERDGRTLDLLLVTDITPREFVFGKMFGTFFNSKEMILLPLALCVYLWWQGALVGLELFYLLVGLCVLFVFAAMLGLHVGMIYESSRHAIAVSLGTIFFLFVGVATCIWMMVAFSGRFEAQLPFLGLIVFGGAALYLALGVRNPSTALGIASFACPLMTFYAITSFFLQQPHLVFVTIVGGYGFATAAMLIPAIDEFDVATGRTTVEE
ncbi:MAG: ABC transporter permease [Thermoguttaceae bacterium]|nr:ABC transporter permease [Thermoguttaceae bacterium]MDW8078070.1 ABC transporter permease subunit [Thermoguttaceae bacterium]